jgi:hypothetical protein
MRWRTYDCLRRPHDIAEELSIIGLMRLIDRLETSRGRR